MVNSDNITIIIGESENIVVATLTIYLLPRIREGGYVAIFEDVLVASNERGKNIGSNLMKYAIELCKRNKKIKKIKLGTRVDETLYLFYEKLGFEFKEKLMQLQLN